MCSYLAGDDDPVGDASRLLPRLRDAAPAEGSVLLGFDFPFGSPAAYATIAGITRFSHWLPMLGRGDWTDFYRAAERSSEIGTFRPFYPQRPGGTSFSHLLGGLQAAARLDLLRMCERGTPSRGPASPLFWTMGAKQVGKAAISGWRDVLTPGLRDHPDWIRLWPFDGLRR